MFEITFLGTSASIPTATRSLPAILVKHEGQRFLVDCGEGTQLRLMQAGESLKIPHIFLTHDHLDHILGLGGLLFSLSLRRMQPAPHVTIYGGSTTLDRARTLASMLRSSEKGKVFLELDYVEVSPGTVFESDTLEVTAFPTDHRERPCFGYVFRSKGRKGVKVVFTGDTRYMDSLIEVASRADCLVCEANYSSDKETQAAKVGHLTVKQAASIAAAAGAKCIMLNHISREYIVKLAEFLKDSVSIFPNIVIPSDLDVFNIEAHQTYLVQSPATEIRTVESLATLGTASAAMTHRVSNTLNLISPSIRKLRRRIDPDDREADEILEIIDRNVLFAMDFVARIAGSLKEAETDFCNVNTLLYEVWDSLRKGKTELFEGVQTRFQLSDQVPLIVAGVGQLAEVFRNLMLNAVEAMQPDGGMLTISSCYLKQKGIIVIEIADTGRGIPPSILNRLFAQPVPSKDSDGGRGLGLWLSNLMLKRYGGEISVKVTSQEQGTVMVVRLFVAPSYTASE